MLKALSEAGKAYQALCWLGKYKLCEILLTLVRMILIDHQSLKHLDEIGSSSHSLFKIAPILPDRNAVSVAFLLSLRRLNNSFFVHLLFFPHSLLVFF